MNLGSRRLHNGPLVIDNFPTCRSAFPDSRPSRGARPVLNQGISKQIEIAAKLPAMELLGLPDVLVRLRIPPLEPIENTGSTISATGSANFPKIRRYHVFEISSCAAKFGSMKNRLTLNQFVTDAHQLWIGRQNWLDMRAHGRRISERPFVVQPRLNEGRMWPISSIPQNGLRRLLLKGTGRRQAPTRRSTKSQAVVSLTVGACDRLQRHSATANEYCPCVDGPCGARGFLDVSARG
jgi:hypothetical protein